MSIRNWCWCAGVLLGVAGCSPALNWREVAGVDGERWWFPCKPDRIERQVSLDGQTVPARMLVCDAQGATWSVMALAWPGQVDAARALAPARMTLMMNMNAIEQPMPAGLTVSGAQPHWLSGRRADGEAVAAVAQFRVRGAWLVQQVVMSSQVDWAAHLTSSAIDPFFSGAMPH